MKELPMQPQEQKTQSMIQAVFDLDKQYPGRLTIELEDDLIRTTKIGSEVDPDTKRPLEPLQIEIETDLSLLRLGKTDDMAKPPAEGYIVVEFRSGDTVENEHHFHFKTVEEVIDYMKFKIAPN